jgi:hypothetical protein
MEEKEHLNLNQLKAEKGVLKIVRQEEETPVVFYPSPVEISGTIQAPGNFIQKREDKHESKKANVLYSYRGLYINLRTEEDADNQQNDRKQLYYQINGKLLKNPMIEDLQVNTKKRFSVKDLTEMLRFNRQWFADKDSNLTIVTNLQKFKLTAQAEIEANNDNRGNAKDLYEIKNTSNMDLGFVLEMPLFIGQPKKKFRVDIEYRIIDRNIEVWLTSADLAEALALDAIEIIDKELTRFPTTFVFIEQ